MAGLTTPGFFVTVTFDRKGHIVPIGIEAFVHEKLERIAQGATGRKYIYKEEGWRMIFTFFPTDRVVSERYALKNKVLRHKPHE